MKTLYKTMAVLIALVALPATAQTLYFSQDIPTDPLGFGNQMPWEVYSHTLGNYVNELSLPPNASVDAVHRMDRPGNWLFSLAHPSSLGGLLVNVAQGHDVVRYDGPANAYSFFFCGAGVTPAIPRRSDIDAVYLEAASGGDSGDLIVSFDVPTEIGATVYEPSDLVRYTKVGPGCPG